jgi:hypothetical protein
MRIVSGRIVKKKIAPAVAMSCLQYSTVEGGAATRGLRKIPCSHPVLHRRIAHLMKAIGPAILLLFPILLLSFASGNHEPFAENPPIARCLDALET